MRNKKTNLAILGILVFSVLFSISRVRAEENQTKMDPNFKQEYLNYLKQLPPQTPLNGGESGKLKSVFPSQRMPFSILKLDIDKKDKFSFKAGEKVNLAGKLTYTWKGPENLAKVRDLCLKMTENDDKACKSYEILPILEFNDIGVWTQVWRKDESDNKQKGDFLVTEFYTLEGKSLKEGQSIPVAFNWKVPAEIPEGDYYVSFFVDQGKYFDLAGTPLTVFQENERFDFGIESTTEGIELDKNAIKINGAEYAYRKPAPTVEGEEVAIELPIKNLNKTQENAEITYELYRWGRTNSEDLIESKKETKQLLGEAIENLKFTFAPNNVDSVYDLKIIAKTAKSETSAYARFVMKGKSRGIFRFLSVLKDGDNLKPMLCIRNANWEGKFKGKVRLTLNGQMLLEEDGSMDASEENCFASKESIPPKNTCQTLKGEILNLEGKVTDERSFQFGNCQKEEESRTAVSQKDDSWRIFLLVIASFTVILIGGLVILKNKGKK